MKLTIESLYSHLKTCRYTIYKYNWKQNFKIGNKTSKSETTLLKLGTKLQNWEQNFKIRKKTFKFGTKIQNWKQNCYRDRACEFVPLS